MSSHYFKLIAFVTCFLSFAQPRAWAWTETLLETTSEMNANPIFSNPYTATAWGALKDETRDLTDNEKTYNTIYLKSSYYGKKLPAYLRTQKQGNSPFTRIAPLMVIMPGIFNSAFESGIIAKSDHFFKLGYHVLVLPNPWSSDSIQHKPVYHPGHIVHEGEWLLEAIDRACAKEINYKYVNSISLYGESYGALLGAIASGLDHPENPILTGDVMLASPPVKIDVSYQQLDRIFDETVNQHGYCKSKLVSIGLNLMRAHSEADFNQASLDCAEPLTALVFNKNLTEAMRGMQKAHLDVPGGDFDAHFHSYVENFAPELSALCSQSEECNLSHWLDQSRLHGKTNVNVVASKDDFINFQADWADISNKLTSSGGHLALLNWGGHLGYTAYQPYRHSFYNP